MPNIVLDEWIDLGVRGCREITVTLRRTSGVDLGANCEIVTIDDTEFPQADWNVAYSHALTAIGGIAPYTFSLVSGTIPDGTNLSSAGVLSGTPTTFGDFNPTIRVQDSIGHFCEQLIPLNVDLGADIWLKANNADSTGVLSNGQAVNPWFDISGNGRHYTTGTLSSDVDPIYTTNVLSGKPGVHFGVLAGLCNEVFNPLNLGPGVSHTTFLVLQSTSNTAVGRRALAAGTPIGSVNFLVGPYAGFWQFYNGAFVTGPAIDLNPHYCHIVVDGASNNGTFVFDGTTIGSNVGTQVLGLAGLGNLFSGEDYLGYVFEKIVFARVLSAQEITYIINYLKAEWPALP